VQVCLGFLVSDGDSIVIVNAHRLHGHDIITQGLLEVWRHEVIAGSRSREDGEVDLKPEEVEKNGTIIKPNTRATKCFPNSGSVRAPCRRLMSRRPQRSMATADPIVKKVKTPTYLVEITQLKDTPVKSSHFHHFRPNGSCRSL
jgi:hypothetical protein